MISEFIRSNANGSVGLVVGVDELHGAVVVVQRTSTSFEDSSGA